MAADPSLLGCRKRAETGAIARKGRMHELYLIANAQEEGDEMDPLQFEPTTVFIAYCVVLCHGMLSLTHFVQWLLEADRLGRMLTETWRKRLVTNLPAAIAVLYVLLTLFVVLEAFPPEPAGHHPDPPARSTITNPDANTEFAAIVDRLAGRQPAVFL